MDHENNSQFPPLHSSLPKGYKQTEVGVIPEDWNVHRVYELVNHGPKNGYSGRSGKDGQGTPTLSLTATSSGRLVLDAQTVKYLEARIDSNSGLFLKPGDILVQRSNTIDLVGTTAIFTGPPTTFIYPDLMMRLRFKEPASANWFWCYANSIGGRRFFMSIAAGSTGSMPKISGEKLRQMPVPIPPLLEQEAIAEALSDADFLIESLTQLIAKKRQIKQGAMQELLTGKRRLHGFANTTIGYKQTEVGVIPEDWESSPLPNIIWFQEGPGLRNWQFRPSGLKVINVTNLQENGYLDLNKTERHISWEEFERTYKHFLIDDGDVVIASSGNSYCKTAVVRQADLPLLMNTSVIRFKAKEGIGRLYMLIYLKSAYFKDQIDLMITGGAQPNFGPAHLKRIFIPLPPTKAEQEAIAEALSDMDAEITALEIKLTKAREIKQGMMHNLLTGRIRLV